MERDLLAFRMELVHRLDIKTGHDVRLAYEFVRTGRQELLNGIGVEKQSLPREPKVFEAVESGSPIQMYYGKIIARSKQDLDAYYKDQI